MLLTLLRYGYRTGVYSSRKIAGGCEMDLALRMLSGGPGFRTLPDFRPDFRKEDLEACHVLVLEVPRRCREAGLVRLGHRSLDGSKYQANAAKHQAMSYGRMQEMEPQLEAEVKEFLGRAAAVDEVADAQYDPEQRGDELPEELRRREGRLEENLTRVGVPEGERRPKWFTAAAGYCGEANLRMLAERQFDTYVATGRGRRHRGGTAHGSRSRKPEQDTAPRRHAGETADHGRAGGLGPAQSHHRTRSPANQAGPELPAVPASGSRQGGGSVHAGSPDPQDPETVASQPGAGGISQRGFQNTVFDCGRAANGTHPAKMDYRVPKRLACPGGGVPQGGGRRRFF